MPRRDFTQIAYDLVQRVTGEKRPDERTPYQKSAEVFGRAGGLKGGHARKKSLKPAERTRIAKKAAAARWSKKS